MPVQIQSSPTFLQTHERAWMSLGEEGAATVRVAKRATARGRNFILAVGELFEDFLYSFGLFVWV